MVEVYKLLFTKTLKTNGLHYEAEFCLMQVTSGLTLDFSVLNVGSLYSPNLTFSTAGGKIKTNRRRERERERERTHLGRKSVKTGSMTEAFMCLFFHNDLLTVTRERLTEIDRQTCHQLLLTTIL